MYPRTNIDKMVNEYTEEYISVNIHIINLFRSYFAH